MSNLIITIGREYGAGGRTVAAGLSKELGIPYYDRDFVRETVKKSGYTEEEILEEGEQLSNTGKFLDAILNNAAAYNSSHDEIFKAQKEVLMGHVGETCIIVGRCSNVILREAGVKTFDIFLYADMEHKLKRAEELHENGKTDLKKFVEEIDKLRGIYYKTYTKHNIGDYHDYDMIVNTGKIGIEQTIKELADMIRPLI
ncbi:Cytidylate kinase [Lachnospiraceae bacterium KH1T2]|nr:Cytidylate kinase [Lachnospiraceae bacterium KH1T2]